VEQLALNCYSESDATTVSTSPSIRAMMIVWRISGKIIRTVLCCNVCTVVLSYIHTHMNWGVSVYVYFLFVCTFVFFFLNYGQIVCRVVGYFVFLCIIWWSEPAQSIVWKVSSQK